MSDSIPEKPVIVIIGAGALGSYYGGRLAQGGHEVHFLMRTDAAVVKRKGLVVKSCKGDFTLAPEKMHVHADAGAMPKSDVVIVSLKSTANRELGRLVRPVVKEGTILLTLQNGLGNEEALTELAEGARVFGGVAFVCINRLEAGVIDHSAHGLIRIGSYVGEKSNGTLTRLAALFSDCNIDCQVIPDLKQARWEKLLWNIPFNGLSAVLDLATDKLLATAEGVELVKRVMGDVIAAAGADGITIDPELIEKHIANTRNMGAYLTSSHVDRRQGRAIEVEALFGRPLEITRGTGVRVPWLEMLVQQVRVVDSSRGG